VQSGDTVRNPEGLFMNIRAITGTPATARTSRSQACRLGSAAGQQRFAPGVADEGARGAAVDEY
jgi:hypothetical protein